MLRGESRTGAFDVLSRVRAGGKGEQAVEIKVNAEAKAGQFGGAVFAEGMMPAIFIMLIVNSKLVVINRDGRWSKDFHIFELRARTAS
jgi:hypothetical protein